MAHRQAYREGPATHATDNLSTATFTTSRHSTRESDWAIPTLGDTYELLMTYSAHTVQFLHEQMENGHCLPDPWDEACALEKAMTRTAHLFYCLWQSEGDPVRFENIREWASVVYTDAKTKLTAIKLFVKLEQRRRQRRSDGSCTTQLGPCNPTPATPDTPTKYDSTPREIDISKDQATPDPRMPSKIIQSMDSKPEAQDRQTHAMQTIRQDGQLLNIPEPDLARRTRNFIESKTPMPANRRDQSPRHAERPTRYRVDPPTPPAPHKVKPGNYYTQTRTQSPREDTLPYNDTLHTFPEPGYIPPGINAARRHSYQGQTRTTPNDNARQRYPGLTWSTNERDERREGNRDEERRFPDTRNEHRKRKTAATEETAKW